MNRLLQFLRYAAAPFCILSFSGLALSTLAVSAASSWAAGAGWSTGGRTLVAEVANVGTFGALERRVAPGFQEMTLRLRLVLALLLLVAAGLASFGIATYSLFSRSQYQHLDVQLRASEPLVERQLEGEPGPGPRVGPGADLSIPSGTWAALLSPVGTVVNSIAYGSGTPKLPSTLPSVTDGPKLITVGADRGPTGFRVLVMRVPQGGGGGLPGGPFGDGRGNLTQQNTIVLAAPLGDVTNSLHRLVLDETAGSLALLLLLSAGAWLILRRGLHPLEQMAVRARSINTGDLSQRVTPAGGPSEVGQLGLALNTMLDDIEGAFQQREATERRLRQFLADASHELRTPLTSIQGFAELFRLSSDHAQVDLPTILRRIEEESARMKVLVEDLLLLARLDQTRTALRSPVDLAVLAADACSDAVAQDRTRAVTLDAPEPVVVAGDEDHLRQAIGNLVSNAVRHTPAGTPIEMSARLAGGEALVTVRDHGPGLDEGALGHVFDRFWQADRARVGTGAGLGLAIVASIAGEHGGTAVAANAVGGGAVFTLRLPLQGVEPAVPATLQRSTRHL